MTVKIVYDIMVALFIIAYVVIQACLPNLTCTGVNEISYECRVSSLLEIARPKMRERTWIWTELLKNPVLTIQYVVTMLSWCSKYGEVYSGTGTMYSILQALGVYANFTSFSYQNQPSQKLRNTLLFCYYSLNFELQAQDKTSKK